MKKLTLLLIMLMPIMVFSQGYTGDYFKARNFVQAPMFRTLADTVYRLGGLKADSIYLKGEGLWYKTFASKWVSIGSDIYFNDGNAYIGKTSGTYKLDINGLIGGSNIETNTTSESTKLGYQSGANEVETAAVYNTMLGYQSGYSLTEGFMNTIVGHSAGKALTTGYANIFIGYESGYSNNGYGNVHIGQNSGKSNQSGNGNTFIGYNSGLNTTTQGGNIFIGNNSGAYTTKSNRLIIHSLDNSTEAGDSTKSIIYGVMNTAEQSQTLNVNARLYYFGTFAEIYKTGAISTQSIPTGTTPTKITAFTTNGYSNNCTADVANDAIIITKAGKYRLNLSLTYSSGTTNVTWTAYIFGNAVELTNIHSSGNASTASVLRSTSLGGIIDANSVPYSVEYKVTHDNGSSVNLNILYCNMSVDYIGETTIVEN